MVTPAHIINDALRTLIVGLGATGLSVARYLLEQGVEVAICDSRENPPGLTELHDAYPDVAVFLGAFEDQVFDQADLLVVSPGVPLTTPPIQAARRRGVTILGDIELFVRAAKAPLAVITGSNGKSTVTTMLGEMAKAGGINVAVGGNIGTPALDLLDDAVELYVLELSSFQLETTLSLQAAVATVLNVSADHMDRYESLQSYAAAKAVALQHAGLGVYNLDDPVVMAMSGSDDAWFFTLREPESAKTFGIRVIDGVETLCRGDEAILAIDEMLIPGRHNHSNALAATAMAMALGIDLDAVPRVLRSFRGLPHRTEFVARINDVEWINDSKATNVGACVAALHGLHRDDDSRTVLIAGGDCKDADFDDLRDALDRYVRALVLIGRDAGDIAAIAPEGLQILRAADMDEAVARCAESALPGDRVLLSPACASFDMFRGFEHRGDVFMNSVRRLVQ